MVDVPKPAAPPRVKNGKSQATALPIDAEIPDVKPTNFKSERQAFMSQWQWGDPPKFVVVSGEFSSGKTRFCIGSGAKPARIKALDFEGGTRLFAKQLGIDYTDVAMLMNSRFPRGYQPQDVLPVIDELMANIQDEEYDVLFLDNASPLEDAISQDVEKNPNRYGISQKQLERGGGIKWGAVKNAYFQRMQKWGAKFSQVFIAVHMRDKYSGNKPELGPNGKPKREPKGLETLEMVADLFVILKRENGAKFPSAKVQKERLNVSIYVADPRNPPLGVTAADVEEHLKIDDNNYMPGIVTKPYLPPRIPVCTWPAIKGYMKSPVDLSALKDDERPEQDVITDDDRRLLSLTETELQIEAERARTERVLAESATREEQKTMQANVDARNRFREEWDRLGLPSADKRKFLTDAGLTEINAENIESALAKLNVIYRPASGE